MFLGKNEHGDFILDSNEQRPTLTELEQAGRDFLKWSDGSRRYGQPPSGLCPHEDYPCAMPGGRECLGKLVWWRRYIKEIEACR